MKQPVIFCYDGIEQGSELHRRALNLEWFYYILTTLVREDRISAYEATRHEKQPYFVDFVISAWKERCKTLELAIVAAQEQAFKQSQLLDSQLKESLLEGLKNGQLENWDVFGMLEALSLIDNPPKQPLRKGTPDGFVLLPEWCSEILRS